MLGKRTLAGQVNTKQASITDFKIDKEGPIIEIKLTYPDGSDYSDSWTNQILKYSISASDLVCDTLNPGTINFGGTVLGGLNANGSAVSGTLVGPNQIGGTYTLQADCYDKYGNYSVATRTVRYDFQKPVINAVSYVTTGSTGGRASSGEWVSGSSGYFGINASDSMSGIEGRQSRKIGTTSWRDATTKSTKAESSSGEYELRVLDGAGNDSDLFVFDLEIDTHPPQYSISCSGSYKEAYRVKWTDERSGFPASDAVFKFSCSGFSGTVQGLRPGNKGDNSRTGSFSIPTPITMRNNLRYSARLGSRLVSYLDCKKYRGCRWQHQKC